jgi:hypothetical protein
MMTWESVITQSKVLIPKRNQPLRILVRGMKQGMKQEMKKKKKKEMKQKMKK